GTHTIAYSPDNKFIIDSYSRVDMAPATELRQVSDGKLVTELEKGEVDGTWNHATPFIAKGRDGKTGIYGTINFPVNMEAGRKYPVVENSYAGPQGSPGTLAPVAFGGGGGGGLTALGFITVKIDGMGSFGGSKAFHDVCWMNLKDAGFPDRIAWMKA